MNAIEDRLIVEIEGDMVTSKQVWYHSKTMTIVKITSAIYYRQGRVLMTFLSWPERQLTT